MDTRPPDPPTTPWELAAPETCVLLRGPGEGKAAFKLGLIELVSRNALRLEQDERRGSFGRTTRTPTLLRGPQYGRIGPRSLRSVVDLWESSSSRAMAGGERGVPVEYIAKETVKRYKSLRGWGEAAVLPTLAELGLYERRERKVLGLLPTRRWALTPAGERAKADLEARLAQGRSGLGGWVERDPARALAFLGAAGASALLLDDLYPEFRRLRERAADDGGASTATYAGGGGDGDGKEEPDQGATDADVGAAEAGGLDLGALDVGALDFGAFDGFDGGIDAAIGAVDGGVDAGGGDGGSGGDGGGGGGD